MAEKKQIIQWFPGHMTKALRMMEEELKLCDCVFYCLDARAPKSCLNPKLSQMFNSKPFVYILNKTDLADDKATETWKAYFKKFGEVVLTNAKKSASAKMLESIALKICREKIERQKQKGIVKPIRAMVVGVPNCGKSTIVNNLCGKARAITGNRPGVTRGKQWVRISDRFEVLDTPGTLWPSFDDQNVAENLALIGSIKDDVVNLEDLVDVLFKRLDSLGYDVLKQKYGVASQEEIAKARGFLLGQGRLDLERTQKTILTEFRNGKLGKITLEAIDV